MAIILELQLLFTAAAQTDWKSHSTAEPEMLSAGVHWRQLPETVIYESSVPLYYRVPWQLPTYEGDGQRLRENSDFHKYYPKLWNISQSILDLDNKFGVVLTAWETSLRGAPEVHTATRKRRGIELFGQIMHFCCNLVTASDVTAMGAGVSDVNTALHDLQNNIVSDHQELFNLTNSMSQFNFELQASYNMTFNQIKNLKQEITNLVNFENESDNVIHEALNIIYKKIIHMIHNEFIISAYTKMSETMMQCNNKKLSKFLVSETILIQDLKILESNLVKNNFELSISVKNIQKYYNLNIVSCVLQGEELVVSVKVPIRQLGHNWKLFEIINVPFAFNNQTCSVKHDVQYLAVTNDGTYKKAITGAATHQCRPYEDSLCYLPRHSSFSFFGSYCIFKLFEGMDKETFNKYCSFICHSDSPLIVSELERGMFSITNPSPNLRVKCIKTNFTYDFTNRVQIGAAIINLPCDCELFNFNDKIIAQTFPCEKNRNNFQMTQIVPIAWTNFTNTRVGILSDYSNNNIHNLLSNIDMNWTAHAPHIVLQNIHTLKGVHEVKEGKVMTWYAGYSSLEYMWSLILSMLLFLIIFKNPWLILPTMAAPAQAETFDLQMIDEIILFLILIIFMMFLIIKRILKCRQRNNTQQGVVDGILIIGSQEVRKVTFDIENNKMLHYGEVDVHIDK